MKQPEPVWQQVIDYRYKEKEYNKFIRIKNHITVCFAVAVKNAEKLIKHANKRVADSYNITRQTGR